MKRQTIAMIGVPMDLGADRRGVDMGPSAIRCAGIESRLEQLGYVVEDHGDLVVRRAKQYAVVPDTHMKYLYEIARVNSEVADWSSRMVEADSFPLILGGDHSIAIGSISGLAAHKRKLGVIWYDAHGDVNTADTTPSGNIHGMSLAILLGHGHPVLKQIGGIHPKIRPEQVVLIGTRSLDPGERTFLKQQGIHVFSMHELDRLGMVGVIEQAIAIASDGTDGVHLSLDLDALDPHDAPGVGTPVRGGLSLRESMLAMEMLAHAGVVTSADVVEVNPTLDTMNQTAIAATDLVAALLGETIL